MRIGLAKTTLTTIKTTSFRGGQLPADLKAPHGCAARKKMLFIQVVLVVSKKTYRQGENED